MRIVLDTNVFMSGVFFKGPPHQILKGWQQGKIELVLSPAILEEYRRVGKVLKAKYPSIDIQPFFDFLTVRSIIVSNHTLPEQICEDPDDDKFIACAISSRSKIIVSGDRDLLKVTGLKGINVLRPRDFIDEYL